jgi:hypothetical protein
LLVTSTTPVEILDTWRAVGRTSIRSEMRRCLLDPPGTGLA